MKASVVIKCLLFCSVISLVLLLYKVSKYSMYESGGSINIDTYDTLIELEDNDRAVNSKKKLSMKYILQWTSPNNIPFVYMGEGRQGFIERNCSFTDCFVTANRTYLGDYTKFDVIAFAGPEVRFLDRYSHPDRLPMRRSPHQKFVFASIESADNYPVCSKKLDGFFNWTWTYRLDSDARWGYMAIRDSKNNIIGPNVNMNWMKLENMDPVSDDIKERLKTKMKAVAWFVSNCHSRSGREIFFRDLEGQLAKYDLKIDVYGECGRLSCSRDNEDCSEMIARDYYFYLSFENSFAEDYVTEKLLHPLKNYAVPIVYGGANYSRFMPDGIYLDAIKLGVEELAQKINELIKDPNQYVEFFRWRKYYSYHRRFESLETDDYCRFCSMIHDTDLVQTISVYENFQEWWDPPNRC